MIAAKLCAAVALPVVALLGAPAVSAEPPGNCLSWIGARGTGQCISEGTGGIPSVGFNGSGIETSSLFPGQSINIPLG
ncbi:hypothetical protein [Mycobacterium sp. ACS4331]|uniref:DUF7155 family protein n=1 Tax=Mycobacterium sp. ACS4331 TaxID=1834121 RepID=UPI0007FC5707|nr:hypothetical protein [Mycobacterium sp. ACS4331]OBF30439.1 hypothetical protein A5727_00035 [Mycobacterium sp. ACS4331]